MKSRLFPVVILNLIMSTLLSCAMVDRALNREPAMPQDQVVATEPTEEFGQVEVTPTEGPRRLELAPTPTAFVVSEDDPRAILDLEHPDHVDYFDNPDTWYDYDMDGRAAYLIEDGRLIGTDYMPEETEIWWTYTDRDSGNVYAEVSATNGDCIGRDSLGMGIRIDRATALGGYSLEVSCDGEFRFLEHSIDGNKADLIEWTASDVVQTGAGATNRLGVWGYQGRFHLFINGVEVSEVSDKNYSHTYGTFALFTRASQTYDLTGTFDDFAYWNIKFIP